MKGKKSLWGRDEKKSLWRTDENINAKTKTQVTNVCKNIRGLGKIKLRTFKNKCGKRERLIMWKLNTFGIAIIILFCEWSFFFTITTTII